MRKTTTPKKEPHLTGAQIQRQVFRRLKKYNKLNFLEQFAMFIGSAQILEAALKHLLAERYGYNLAKLERWTLGKTTRELKDCGLRQDFIALLESVVKYRNHIAHELLVSEAILRSLVADTGRLERKRLDHGIYELEQVMFLYDWCNEHNAWG
jgi:hypothetical protein